MHVLREVAIAMFDPEESVRHVYVSFDAFDSSHDRYT